MKKFSHTSCCVVFISLALILAWLYYLQLPESYTWQMSENFFGLTLIGGIFGGLLSFSVIMQKKIN
jgi:hypothetical protein